MNTTINEDQIANALVNPASVFSNPMEVVAQDGISPERKIKILKRWEYDALEMQVAVEEGFPVGESGALLDEVIAALHKLGAGPDLKRSPPTKQGGV